MSKVFAPATPNLPGQSWQERAQAKLESRDSKSGIPPEWLEATSHLTTSLTSKDDVTKIPSTLSPSFISFEELAITETPLLDLQAKLATGEWKSVDVTRAYAKRAWVAHRLTNCLTEIFVDRALERAQELDEHLAKTGKVLGPFHGIPVSLKDQINIKGLETTIGYVSWIGHEAEENSIIVDCLEAAGAVLFVKTNVPQTLMWLETHNNIYGRTSNPYNRTLTPGGSSGGEGALIAMRGSAIGVGSDVGGSIRIPASFNGLYGLRASFERLPYTGIPTPLDGQNSVPFVIGPISPSLDGVKLFFWSIINQKPWLKDPYCIRKPWNEEEYKLVDHGGNEEGRKLCFGIIWDDGIVVPHPPILRALGIVKEQLENVGHKVIAWRALHHKEICENAMAIAFSGATEDFGTSVLQSDEPVFPNMHPDWTPGSPPRPGDRGPTPTASAIDMWKLQATRRAQQKAYLDFWNDTVKETGTGRPVDAIIAPVSASASAPHGMNSYLNYTLVWNALDYPGLSIPVTKVNAVLDPKPSESREFLSTMDQLYHSIYDPESYINAPAGILLVARTLEEEALIGMGEIVDQAIRGNTFD